MLIDLKRLFDGYADEKGTDMDFITTDIDRVNTERIKTMTMKRISAAGRHDAKKALRVVAAVAVIAALLTGTVFAAEYIGGLIRVRTNVAEAEYDENGEMMSPGIGAEIEVDALDGMTSTLVGMRLGYQPQMDEYSVMETVFYVWDQDCARILTHLRLLSEETGITDSQELYDLDTAKIEAAYADAMEARGYGRLEGVELAEKLTGEVIEEVTYNVLYSDAVNAELDKYGINDESMKDVMNHIYRSDNEKAWGATAYKATADKQYVMDGTAEVVKEGVINGMTAIYMTNAYECGEYLEVNDIILRDESTGIVLAVYGSIDFDELEKIAAGIEIVDTGLPIIDDEDSFGGLIATLAQG